MLLTLALASWQINVITDLTQRFATQDMQRLLRVQALSLTTEGAGNALLHLMNAPREQRVPVYAEVDERNRRIEGLIESLDNSLGDLTQVQTMRRLNEARANYADAFIATVDEIEGEDAPAAWQLYNTRVQPALKQMLIESNLLINRERERVEGQVAATQSRLESVTWWVAALSLVAVVLAVALALGTTKSVVVPMSQLEAVARRIAAGDYVMPIMASSTEEVDRVSHALSTMTRAIAQRETEIERLAFRDPLTDLPNRTFLLKQCDAAGVSTAGNAFMLFDLARLKNVNETLGYAIGDTLISTLAQRAREVVQAAPPHLGALLVHLSGGKFAVMLTAPTHAPAEALSQQLMAATAQPLQCGGHSVDLSLAFGLADSPMGEPLEVITLLRNAEVALSVAKKAAQAVAWYNPAQEAARLSHLGLLSDLRAAVTESQLQMWLQPKFSLQTGLAVGAEALVRWQHPTRGFVSPAEFVPFAEQTGSITLVTDWMLGQAVATLQRWQATQPDLSLSVNVSTRDLQNPTFCQRVKQLIQQHSVDPTKLRLEIVESGLMQDTHTSIALLHRLRDMGVQLSIDDFGTGYSSLAYLQQLPVTELKIDRAFITGIDAQPLSQRLVKTMIDMGHGMGLMVTAEGIETEAERDTLKTLGCDVMQGYFGSRPLYGAALAAWWAALAPAKPQKT
jgi:diguanylate cyclase (GGDEF)-like protein